MHIYGGRGKSENTGLQPALLRAAHVLLSVLSLTQEGLSCCTFRQKVSVFADCGP